MKTTVDIDKIDDEYKPFIKDEMTTVEISLLGQAILKNKVANIKNKISRWRNRWRRRKE